jgi:hypothetical protein
VIYWSVAGLCVAYSLSIARERVEKAAAKLPAAAAASAGP